jgi:peptidoglycan/LPS O-acetylase OafA/YrhL
VFIDPQAMGAAMFLFLLIHSSRLKNILTNKFLVVIGSVSYSIYLSHLLILALFLPLSASVSPLLLFVMVLSATLLYSMISFVLIERPAIMAGRKLSAHREA